MIDCFARYTPKKKKTVLVTGDRLSPNAAVFLNFATAYFSSVDPHKTIEQVLTEIVYKRTNCVDTNKLDLRIEDPDNVYIKKTIDLHTREDIVGVSTLILFMQKCDVEKQRDNIRRILRVASNKTKKTKLKKLRLLLCIDNQENEEFDPKMLFNNEILFTHGDYEYVEVFSVSENAKSLENAMSSLILCISGVRYQ